jgi:hypothetical protein
MGHAREPNDFFLVIANHATEPLLIESAPHFAGCASGNFHIPSTTDWRGWYIRAT